MQESTAVVPTEELSTPYAVEMRGITKSWPGIVANDHVDLKVRKGEIHALVGENGAGQICKIANQVIVALTIEAVGEGLLFASKAGADPVKVRQALMGAVLHGSGMRAQ